MKFLPLHDFVFVERDKPEEKKTPGGLYMPKTGQKPPDTAKVLAVGPGRTLDDGTILKISVKEGDTVIISRHAGININWGPGGMERKTVVPFSDILGVVEFEP